MVADKESQTENKRSGSGNFQADRIASFLKSKDLNPLSLILLDMMIPFKRQISAFLSITEPVFSLVLGSDKAGKIVGFSNGENSLEALKEAIERGEE